MKKSRRESRVVGIKGKHLEQTVANMGQSMRMCRTVSRVLQRGHTKRGETVAGKKWGNRRRTERCIYTRKGGGLTVMMMKKMIITARIFNHDDDDKDGYKDGDINDDEINEDDDDDEDDGNDDDDEDNNDNVEL